MSPVWTSRLGLCALVLLGLTGCSDDGGDPPIVCDLAPFPGPMPAQAGLMTVGQTFTLSVAPSFSGECSAEPSRPTSVTAEIEGPGGEPIEGQLQFAEGSALATLRFTPVRPGPHHILVAFAQVGGIHQFDLHAVVDSSATVPRASLSRRCDSLERTQQGAWVCDTQVLRDQSPVNLFVDARVAVAGDVLWVVTGSTIGRYVDTGTDLVLTGSLSHSRGAATFVLASADELAVVHDNTLALYTFTGGTLTTVSTAPWNRPLATVGIPGPFGVLLREGNQLAVVTRESVNFQPIVQVCPYQFVSGQGLSASGTCLQLPGDTVGFEPRVLWTREPPSMSGGTVQQGIIHRWEWTGGRLVEQGSVSLGVHLRLMFPPLLNPSTVPVVVADQGASFSGQLTAVATWSAERRAILFEHLDPEVIEPHASPAFYWGSVIQTASNEVSRVRLRPQPPNP